jgi:hypothetical protein
MTCAELEFGDRGRDIGGGGEKRGHKAHRYIEINDMIFGKR